MRWKLSRIAAKARIEELKVDAASECLQVSEASERDLNVFLDTNVFTHRPLIVLLDNGNFRVVWENAAGERISLQFRGDGEVQFVIVREWNGDLMTRTAGRDTLANIGRQIDANWLGKLE